ncbi:MAG TPA: alpha-L-fucosidase [Chitinophagaceae bacterium]|nr:alpha-L-fucosidase [Chitinophagaceae bacterium]
MNLKQPLSFSKIYFVFIAVTIASSAIAQGPPAPFGPVPNARQIEWYHREITAFFHFGMNTFTNDNEGDGTASPRLFNPTTLDCNQWMEVLKSAGIPAAILVAKHADGFCNWPSAHTNYSVKNSPWKNGKGDVVQAFTDACKTAQIKAGIYLGPHDRHDSRYGTDDYSDYYADQLSELLRNYGPVWEIWWDGAGADKLPTSFYTRWADTVRKLQPHCVIFGTKNSYPFADCRWVGNESGEAGDPCWSTINPLSIRDEQQHINELNHGEIDGTAYIPAEVDASVRPSWFYHPEEDNEVKPVAKLWEIYLQSVGRNSELLLNFSPNKKGLIAALDIQRVDSLRYMISTTFKNNLAAKAKIKALHPRGDAFKPSNLTDTLESTYYATPDAFTTDTLTFTLDRSKTFNIIMLQEVIELGQRTTGWSVDYSTNGKKWMPIPEASNKQSIGYKWIIKCKPVTAKYVRLRITNGKACPAIHTFGLYEEAAMLQ